MEREMIRIILALILVVGMTNVSDAQSRCQMAQNACKPILDSMKEVLQSSNQQRHDVLSRCKKSMEVKFSRLTIDRQIIVSRCKKTGEDGYDCWKKAVAKIPITSAEKNTFNECIAQGGQGLQEPSNIVADEYKRQYKDCLCTMGCCRGY